MFVRRYIFLPSHHHLLEVALSGAACPPDTLRLLFIEKGIWQDGHFTGAEEKADDFFSLCCCIPIIIPEVHFITTYITKINR